MRAAAASAAAAAYRTYLSIVWLLLTRKERSR
jgi:hypothetical protein